MHDQFWLLAGAGFLAQLVDGALGMAFGVISTSLLLTLGVSPAAASAAVHAAEIVTTGASGVSHMSHRNVDWRLCARLAVAGVIGSALGAYLLVVFSGNHIGKAIISPIVSVYLMAMGGLILSKAFSKLKEAPPHPEGAIPLGLAGGFLGSIGGGGWGPVTASTLMGRGHTPRMVIGSVNTAEFFVTVAASATFLLNGVYGDLWIVGGLVAGGVAAAPFGGFLARRAPARATLLMVGALVISLSVWRLWTAFHQPLLAAAHHLLGH